MPLLWTFLRHVGFSQKCFPEGLPPRAWGGDLLETARLSAVGPSSQRLPETRAVGGPYRDSSFALPDHEPRPLEPSVEFVKSLSDDLPRFRLEYVGDLERERLLRRVSFGGLLLRDDVSLLRPLVSR